MKIDWKQTARGWTPMQIRNVLARSRRENEESVTIDSLTRAILKENEGEGMNGTSATRSAQSLLEVMAASGLIGAAQEDEYRLHPVGPDVFGLTANGRSLRIGGKGKRKKRTEAEAILALVVADAEAVNADPIHGYDIVKLSVYGSYLGDSPDLGDLDMFYELKRRPSVFEGTGDHDASERDRREKAILFEEQYPAPESQSVYNIGLMLSYEWGRTVIKRLLRVNRFVSMSEAHNVEGMGCRYLQLMPERLDVPAKPEWQQAEPFEGLIDDGGAALRAIVESFAKTTAIKTKSIT